MLSEFRVQIQSMKNKLKYSIKTHIFKKKKVFLK